MPRTNEIAFNVRLLDVLRTKHPRWRNHTSVEQQGIVRETALRPDIVIRPPGGIPVILETKFAPAHSVEADAQARLGQFLQYNGDRIEQTIAVQIPRELSQVPQADLSICCTCPKRPSNRSPFCATNGAPSRASTGAKRRGLTLRNLEGKWSRIGTNSDEP